MTILFAISVAAFVAIMWASISIARHVRRTRRRRVETPTGVVPTFSPEAARAAEALAAGAWGRTSRPDWKAAPPPPLPEEAHPEPEPLPTPIRDFVPTMAPLKRPEPQPIAPPEPPPAREPIAAAPAPPAIPAPAPIPSVPEIRFPLTSQRIASSAAIAVAREAALASAAAEPTPEPAPEPRSPQSSASQPATNFQLRRPPAPAPDSRSDWAYFNKDMGDLRDPEPRFRERPRGR